MDIESQDENWDEWSHYLDRLTFSNSMLIVKLYYLFFLKKKSYSGFKKIILSQKPLVLYKSCYNKTTGLCASLSLYIYWNQQELWVCKIKYHICTNIGFNSAMISSLIFLVFFWKLRVKWGKKCIWISFVKRIHPIFKRAWRLTPLRRQTEWWFKLHYYWVPLL